MVFDWLYYCLLMKTVKGCLGQLFMQNIVLLLLKKETRETARLPGGRPGPEKELLKVWSLSHFDLCLNF